VCRCCCRLNCSRLHKHSLCPQCQLCIGNGPALVQAACCTLAPVAGEVTGSNPAAHMQLFCCSLGTELAMLQGWQMQPGAALTEPASHQ
jgi:hypothetical protein